ncbi:MAG: molybdopterin-dependent oxidoreductase [Planctomycetes bacterium]|nr:molybdopterin-dependent oxidoreductase [Planctomycetota bacterium]MCH9726747.1 molybdopterin-dependent oxidoreductase [Planctomycetota bacterium]MCH9776772.1 molybdopterin-dependent oxidoreductase [Planctomycetota bacterium]MCH9789400.1 molybdopterin-dependent oxidoreductase [Planctomycetota bacterium]
MYNGPEAEKYQDGDPPPPPETDSKIIVSSDTFRENRIPAGQTRTRKWPVLHATTVPPINLDTWKLEVGGLVETPLSFNWNEFQQLPRTQVFADFHCVTRWSRLGNLWEGVSGKEIMLRANVKPAAKYVLATGYDGDWTTNIPLKDFQSEDVLFCDRHDSEPLDADHGGPLRLIVPLLYAWKSAKWLKRIDFIADDDPGYWERCGYHNHGDPWVVDENNPDGERFQSKDNIPPGFDDVPPDLF